MDTSRRGLIGASLALPGLLAGGARAQEAAWPTRPIALTVPFLAGGSADIASRLLADRMAVEADPAMAGMVGQIEAMLNAAGSLEEFRAMLLAGFPELDASGLASVLAQGMIAAEAAGRVAVLDESEAAGAQG